jgi:hypothetical protein
MVSLLVLEKLTDAGVFFGAQYFFDTPFTYRNADASHAK